MENVRVLVIEDNPVDSLCLKEALEGSRGITFAVTHVETLAEAKECLKKEKFSVLVLDLGLPDSQGLETFFKIQNSAPTSSIVVLSGLDDEDLAREAVRKGAQDYLLKDQYYRYFLARSVTYAIERKHAAEEIRRLNENLEKRIEERTAQLTMANENLVSEISERKRAEEALRDSQVFLHSTLDALTAHIAILDENGIILEVNEAWRRFGRDNEARLHEDGIGLNYLEVCESSIGDESEDAPMIAEMIREIMAGRGDDFHWEYACHSPSEKRWFVMHASRFSMANDVRIVLAHENITGRKLAEMTLKESEARFRSLIEQAPVGICFSREMRTLYANHKYAEMFGFSTPDELLGSPVSERVAPQRLSEFTDRALRREKGLTVENIYESVGLRKDGSEFPVQASVARMNLPEGPVTLGFVTDLTERMRAEEALRESQEKYRLIFENAPLGILHFDPNGVMLDFNDKFAEMIGAPREKLVGFDMPKRQKDRRMRQAVLDALNGKTSYYEGDYLSVTGGKLTPMRAFYRPMIGDDGTLRGGVGIFEDSTELRRAAEALQESEQRYRAVIENLHVGIAVLNREMEIVSINRFFNDVYPQVEPGTGQLCHLMFNDPPQTALCNYCPCAKTFRDGMVHECITETPAGDRIRNYRIISCPIKDTEGNVELVIELVEDITETRSLQLQLAQAQKMEAIGTLAGGVAHDFNNVLQVTLGYSELILSDEELPQSCRADLKKINESARHGADLVQRLLTFSRKTEIKPQPLNLNHRIIELQKMLERTLPKMIDMQLSLEGKLANINADRTQIDQILMNLAVNARDAMPDGGRLIFETGNVTLDEEYTRTHLEARPGAYVRLAVTDTGSGMGKETQEHIFEPFYTTKGIGVGTGLGLAMVHGIVKHHGGHVTCYSEPGEGTSFKIYFPALTETEEKEETIVREMPRGGTETVLLVDDEESIRDLGSRILAKAGYKVVTAANGKEAIEAFQVRADEISLVVLDLMMPEMGGKQCLEEILSIDPTAKVIIASGFSADGPTKDALEDGAKAFANKPYDIRQLLEVVRAVLDEE